MRNNPEKITGTLRRPSAISKMGLILCDERDLSEDAYGFVRRLMVSPDFIVEEAAPASASSVMIRVSCKNYVFLATLELGRPLVTDLPDSDAELYLPLCTPRGETKSIDGSSKELTVTLSGCEDGVQPVSVYFFHVKLLHALSENPLLVFDHSRMFVFTPEWLSLAARSCPSPYTMAHIFFHEQAFFENGDMTGIPIDKETLVVTQGLSQMGLRELEASVDYETPADRERADEIAFIMLDIAVQFLLCGSDRRFPKPLEPVLVGHLHESQSENADGGEQDGFGYPGEPGETLYPIYAAWYPSPDSGNAVLCAFPAGTSYDDYDCSELVPFCEMFGLWKQAGKTLKIENMSFIGDECDSYLYSSRASVSFDIMCRKLQAMMTELNVLNDKNVTVNARVKIYAGTELEFENPLRLLYEEEITNELLGDNFRATLFDDDLYDDISDEFLPDFDEDFSEDLSDNFKDDFSLEAPCTMRESVNFNVLSSEFEEFEGFNGIAEFEEFTKELGFSESRRARLRELFGGSFFGEPDYESSENNESEADEYEEDFGSEEYGDFEEYAGEYRGFENTDEYDEYDEGDFGGGDEIWCAISFENGRILLTPEKTSAVNADVAAGVPVAYDELENAAIVDWDIKFRGVEPAKDKLTVVERIFGVDEAYLFV